MTFHLPTQDLPAAVQAAGELVKWSCEKGVPCPAWVYNKGSKRTPSYDIYLSPVIAPKRAILMHVEAIPEQYRRAA